MAENKKIDIVEGIYDLFDKNIDPLVLQDRLSQAARARDLARSAAKQAEEAGKTDLAAQLNADADRLQQVIDLTKQSANIAKGDQGDSNSSAGKSAGTNTSGTTTDTEEDDAQLAQGDGDDEDEVEPLDSDDFDEDNFDEDDFEDENTSISDNPNDEDKEDSEGEEDKSSNSKNGSDRDDSDEDSLDDFSENGSEDEDENLGEDEPADDIDGASRNSDDQDEETTAEDSESSIEGGDDDEDSNASADSEEDTDEDGSSSTDDDEEYDDNAFGSPKVKDNIILQDPFRNGQVQPELPKDISDKLASGDLQIEPELDAIVRIVSKLKGEARHGAEQALKDYYRRENPWGDIEREDD